jgi:hypothetical protein
VTPQGVQRDNGDASPSSKVRLTYLEACGSKHSEGKKSTKKYFPDKKWDDLSADATPKPTISQKKGSSDKCDESVLRAMKADTTKPILKTIKKLMKLVSPHQKCSENRDDLPPISADRDKGPSHSQDALGRPKEDPKTVLTLNRTCDKEDTTFVVPCSEEALPELLLDMELFNKQQISGAVQVRDFSKKQGYLSTAECGSMLNPEGIPGCRDTP